MGKVAVITGGSSGIGLAIAKLMIQDHFSIAMVARDPEKLEIARKELESIATPDVSILALPTDVTNEAEVIHSLNRVLEQWGKIDWLVASAGYNNPGYFEDQNTEIFRNTFLTNFFGTLHVIRHVLPIMKHRKSGNIVIVSSGAGLIGIFGSSAYSSSKFALTGLAEVLRSETKAHGVKVSIAYPPDTDTPLMRKNESRKPWEAKLLMSTGGFYTPEKVAATIYRGARRGRFAITLGINLFIVNRLKSLLYPYLFRVIDKKVEKGRKEREKRNKA